MSQAIAHAPVAPEPDLPLRTGLTTAAGLVVTAAGITQAASGFQLATLFVYRSALVEACVWAMLVLGCMTVLAGLLTTKARMGALAFSVLLCGLGALSGMIWLIYAATASTFTAASLFAAGFNALGFLFALIAAPATLRVARARKALYSD